MYVEGAELRYYTRWEAPPNTNRENQPFDYLVGIPARLAKPAYVGIHMHAFGANLEDGFGWWFNADQGAILVSSNDVPYDWWTGYHEALGTGPPEAKTSWSKGVVRPYTQNRLLSFVKWLASTRPLDLSRTFAAGASMGGSGSVMLAIRRPEEIAWAVSWVGIHRPHLSPTFRSAYEYVYGPPEAGARFEDGTPAWEHFDDVLYLQRHPEVDVGFITFSNGKNDHGIGWQQAVDFLKALQAARQPHLFIWGQNGHNERAAMPKGGHERTMPLEIHTNRSLPAFTHSTLDDNPGSGDLNDGQPSGQVNLFLEWEPASVVDLPDRWEATLGIRKGAPSDNTRADVTPRRLQHFKPSAGETVRWTNRTGGSTLQTGQIVVDQHGHVTAPQVQLRSGGTRLTLERAPAPRASEKR
jgi:pimeloyl-ACP methyl ester carboxylesterase